ncbi:WW domain-binding protein 11 [Harmonia axyridis]|uniref:WW domain-binding protein 11 n=1 Tax=Harmonia axyridis TaxID=115357 RepID=UPI001E276CAF|nr:WW domain-binding protein 11 [Harmonia axyridis]
MGRRSINTTKSGKYMNPTDQARKEARKQELKKNKKQRQMVRAAVLKGKDPHQILEELEKIDQMEYNVNQPSPLNEKVLKDKRKKLRETLDRVLSMYYKDDSEKWADLKRKQTEYEHKRNQLVVFYESVKSAQQVQVDEIPLPQLPQQQPQNSTASIPLPAEKKQEHTIYSIATAMKLQALGKPIREPPGCPPGPPPIVNEDGEVIDYEDMTKGDETEEVSNENSSKPTSLQQKMVALSGQNIDEFMKEMESVQKRGEVGKDLQNSRKAVAHIEPLIPPGTDPPVVVPAPPNPPSMPVMFPNGGLRLPPGPPPGRPLLPPGLPPPRIPIRLPPAPPRLIRIPGPPPAISASSNLPLATPNVLSAGPQLISRSESGSHKQGATISAKPQIRNLSADVTRFVPSALRVKREDKKSNTRVLVNEFKQKEMHFHQQAMAKQHTKDDAYKQFMQEMQNLM